MKIAIVGAGISGLSTYLFLKKHLPSPPAHTITIYEAHPAPRRKQRPSTIAGEDHRDGASFIGGGLGVAPNGMRVFRDLDPEIHDAITAQGYPAVSFQMKNAHGWTLGSISMADLKGERVSEAMIMSSRQGVWDALRDKVPDEVLVCGQAVTDVIEGSDGRHVLRFGDGSSSAEWDLVIGADGVKSVVKKAVVGDGAKDEYPPHYEGLLGVGGFIPSTYLPPIPAKAVEASHSQVVMTFGAEGFFGYGPSTSAPGSIPISKYLTNGLVVPHGSQAMWWSTYSQDELPDIKKIDKDDVRRQLQERHGKWTDPVIRKIVEEAEITSIVAAWTTPKLPTWFGDGLVLIGDAAHALPSTSGQGVSMALEDAQTLALLLSHYLSLISSHELPDDSSRPRNEREAINIALKKYCEIRKPRVERILDAANQMADRKRKKGLIEEWVGYFVMWIVFRFFGNKLNKPVFEYKVEEAVDKAIKTIGHSSS